MRVAQALILIPVFVQVALTLVVLVALWWSRVAWMVKNRVRSRDIALAGPEAYGESALKLSNNFKNQFELPVLFYVASVFAYCLRMVDAWMFGLAIAFVLARVIHCVFHVGPNWVTGRFLAAVFSALIVAGMWALLMWRVASAGF